MSSISSLLATAIAAIMPLAGSTGPVDAQDQLSQPEPAETVQTAPADRKSTRLNSSHVH